MQGWPWGTGCPSPSAGRGAVVPVNTRGPSEAAAESGVCAPREERGGPTPSPCIVTTVEMTSAGPNARPRVTGTGQRARGGETHVPWTPPLPAGLGSGSGHARQGCPRPLGRRRHPEAGSRLWPVTPSAKMWLTSTMSCSSERPTRFPKMRQTSVRELDYPPEINGKTLLLKTPYAVGTEHGETWLELKREPDPRQLAHLVLEGAT